MTSYYVEGIHYGFLSDLLSDGWAEDKTVQIYTGTDTTVPPEFSTIAQLRGTTKTLRKVAVANEGFAERAPSGGYQYAVAMIVEDTPGWTPGHWYPYLNDAQNAARKFNRAAGHDQETVLEVQVSSMRASRTR